MLMASPRIDLLRLAIEIRGGWAVRCGVGAAGHMAAALRFGRGRSGFLGRVHELADFSTLPIQVGELLFAQLLVGLELFLAMLFIAGADVSLPETVMGVGEVRI